MNELVILLTCFGIILSFGIIIGLFLFYVIVRLISFEKMVKGFPSPEEMALQVLKAKIPVNKLSDEQKESILKVLEKDKKADYFG